MRHTALIGVSLLIAALAADATAQALKDAEPPAEFPPASYRGIQYVDSRGCVYLRAGIDGNVTWVPQVTRQRRQLCGFAPSLSAEQRAAATRQQPRQNVQQITIAPEDRPSEPQGAATAASPAVQLPAPKPRRAPSAAPAPTAAPQVTAAPAAPQPARTRPTRTKRQPAPAPAPTVVRATPAKPKPAAAPAPTPVVRAQPAEAAAVPANTRVVRRHIDEARQHVQASPVPQGYRSVWQDGRLNPRRAERTLAPSVAQALPKPPRGYRSVWQDGRLNPSRGAGSDAGSASMNAIWTQTVPRKLINPPTTKRIIRTDTPETSGNSPFWRPKVAKAGTPQPGKPVSLQSGKAAADPVYLRVAAYHSRADAMTIARRLGRSGLTMRLGQLTRKGATYHLVLSGPFADRASAGQALKRVQAAGFKNAALMR